MRASYLSRVARKDCLMRSERQQWLNASSFAPPPSSRHTHTHTHTHTEYKLKSQLQKKRGVWLSTLLPLAFLFYFLFTSFRNSLLYFSFLLFLSFFLFLKLCSATLIAPHSCCKGFFLGSPLFLSWLTNHSFSPIFFISTLFLYFCSVPWEVHRNLICFVPLLEPLSVYFLTFFCFKQTAVLVKNHTELLRRDAK